MSIKEGKTKPYDCPFCGSHNAIWDSETYSINYCERCHKVLIVLSNAKSTDFVSDLMLKFIHGLRGDF